MRADRSDGARYRLYIDDSGEKEWGERASRYFVYAGIIVPISLEAALTEKVRELKTRHLGRDDVELKCNWVRHPKEREKRYLAPLAITPEQLDAAVDELYGLFGTHETKLVAAVIDKVHMRESYGERAWHPSATAYQFLLQRYQLFLRRIGAAVGEITIDNMTGASRASNQWRDLIRDQHRTLLRDGCRLTKIRFTHVTKSPRFGDSAKFHLLQMADFVAYNCLRQFRDHGTVWDDGVPPLPLYPAFQRIAQHFVSGPNRRLDGFGIVKFPRKNPTIRWYLVRNE